MDGKARGGGVEARPRARRDHLGPCFRASKAVLGNRIQVTRSHKRPRWGGALREQTRRLLPPPHPASPPMDPPVSVSPTTLEKASQVFPLPSTLSLPALPGPTWPH